jgi:solute:Na+ symporter, SSS family
LLGGDLYTAYTFIAVPAAMYGLGALNGWFAVPYTIIVYPLVFVLMPKFWSVCKQRGYVTAADFVRDRFGSNGLALAMAFTGVLATLPYIALQMFGIQVCLAALGIPLSLSILGVNVDLPLIIAFIILAAYTYTSGLRAPAMIALVKDSMIFILLFAIIIFIPIQLGGFGNIFNAAQAKAVAHPTTFFFLLSSKQTWAYSTLALGSALALFLYPHSLTGVLSSSSQKVVKRNTALLPIYSLMLGLLALTGYMAIAALVPASVMSIAAANLFTRNVYKQYLRRDASDREESQVAKWTSLVVKLGALLFIIYIPTQQVINFQLLGGIWILQTLPAVFLGLYTHWFNRWALLIGWALSLILGTLMFIGAGLKPVYTISIGSLTFPAMYAAFSAVIINLVLAIVLTPLFNAIGVKRGKDLTTPADYEEEQALPAEVGREALG